MSDVSRFEFFHHPFARVNHTFCESFKVGRYDEMILGWVVFLKLLGDWHSLRIFLREQERGREAGRGNIILDFGTFPGDTTPVQSTSRFRNARNPKTY